MILTLALQLFSLCHSQTMTVHIWKSNLAKLKHNTLNSSIHSKAGLTLETSAF